MRVAVDVTRDGTKQCIDGSLYRFVSDGSELDIPCDLEGCVRVIAGLLQTLVEQHTWLGVITPLEVRIPAGTQRHHIRIAPSARTIRIETSAKVDVWLNADTGVPIPMGEGRSVVTLSDLPPAAVIHDVIVTTEVDTTIFILGVA